MNLASSIVQNGYGSGSAATSIHGQPTKPRSASELRLRRGREHKSPKFSICQLVSVLSSSSAYHRLLNPHRSDAMICPCIIAASACSSLSEMG